MGIRSRRAAGLLLLATVSLPLDALAERIPLTILHTNDLHSKFRPSRDYTHLGGISRVATIIRRYKKAKPNTLALDGGDWSEGSIYYNIGAGRTSLELMNLIGYDAAVVGNHDWLNGVDHLTTLLNTVKPRFPLLASNLDFSNYNRREELAPYIMPSTIVNVGKLKIGIIGVETYELMYDKFFLPVKITYPFGPVRKLAEELKKAHGIDIVIVISHNTLAINRLLAGLANVDLVVSGHGHNVLPNPITLERKGKTAFVVEAGSFSKYVGKFDLAFDTETKKLVPIQYDLIPMDDSVPEDPEVLDALAGYDRELKQIYGDIFHDNVGELHNVLRRDGRESIYGNFLADAYRDYTGVDVAFEQVGFVTEDLYPGKLTSVDIYDTLSQFFNVKTSKSWTLKTMKMTGETLDWVINFAVNIMPHVPKNSLSISGLKAIYDPITVRNSDISQAPSARSLLNLQVGGKPLDVKKSYTVAMPQGIVEALEFLESYFGNKVPRTEFKDTGVEDWRVLAQYLAKQSPVDSRRVTRGDRLTVIQSDAAIYYDEIALHRKGVSIDAEITVRNVGNTDSPARVLRVSYDKTPDYFADDPNPKVLDNKYIVPALPVGKSAVVSTHIDLPVSMLAAAVPLYFKLDPSPKDPDIGNDETWVISQPDMEFREYPRPVLR